VKIPVYQVDAFTDRPFTGNPAAVCPLDGWLADGVLQAIAAENNLSETAFLVAEEDGFQLRWFTPTCEVDLCGHATLASGFVVLTELDPGLDRVEFSSAGGRLAVVREGDRMRLDFPSRPPDACARPDAIIDAVGAEPAEFHRSRDHLLVYDSGEEVRRLPPDMPALASATDRGGVIATAAGSDCDFVSRFFAPALGVAEDPVTGSAHCTLVPYWASRLEKSSLFARQISARGGELWCEDRGDRVFIAGHAVLVLEGTITL